MTNATDIENGHRAFVAGDLPAASTLARAAFAAAKAASDRAAIGRARCLLGEIAYDELRYGPAREAFALAASELATALGPEHAEARRARVSLATVLSCMNDHDRARSELEAAEAGLAPDPAAAGVPPAGDVEGVRLWLAIGTTRHALGRKDEGRAALDAALRAMPDDDPALAATAWLHSASFRLEAGEAAAAVVEYERCIALRTRAFGAQSPRVAAAAFNLSTALISSNDVVRAHAVAVDAMQTCRALGVDREPRTSTGWATLGLTCLMTGDVPTGTAHFETACKIEEKTFGATHPATASMVTMLAQVIATTGDWGKVAGLCRRIVPSLRDAPGYEATLVSAVELDVEAHSVMGRWRLAADRAGDVIAALARRRAATSGQQARLYAALAHAEIGAGRRERALASLRRARALGVDAFGPDDELVQVIAARLEQLERGSSFVVKGSA